jgi:PAS domain S-box-containing protein
MFTDWLEALFAGGAYEQALVLDENLNVGLVYPEGASGVLSEVALRAAQEALRSRQVVVAELHRETEHGPVYLSLMVPLVVRRESTGDKVPAAGKGSSPDDRSAGVLVLQINAQDEFYPLIQFWPTPSRTAETLLVRRDGNDVLFLNDLKFRTNAALKFRIPLERTNVASVKAVLGQEGIVEGTDYRGEPVLASLGAIPDTAWLMVTRMDLAEVYAPLRARLTMTVLLMVALLLGTGASVGLVWRQQRVQYYRERLEAVAALQLSQQKLALHFDQTPLAVVEFDLEGRVQGWSPAAVTVFGYSREEAIGQHWSFIVPAAIHGQLGEVWAAIVGQRGGKRSTNENITNDGRTISCEWFNTPLIERDGRTIGVASLIQDVTERRRAEEALRESEERYRTIMDQAADAVFMRDEMGRILEANRKACQSLGYSREELLAKSVWDIDPDALQAGKQRLWDKILAGEQFTFESRHRRKDGSFFPVEATLGLVRLPAGPAVLGIVRDITERRQAEEKIRQLNQTLEQRVVERTAQLEAANKELESFSYSVSHDLRAPLRAIDGFARILGEDYAARLDDEGRRLLDIICGEAKRMGQLIDDLLAFSRMSRQQVKSEQIDMTALAQAVFNEHAAQAPGRQLQFKVQPLPPALGDRALLRQALANLVSNAIKYTRPRAVAEIEIGGRTEGGENLYYVKDNGVGFDMRYAGKLFGVFQRLHSADEFEGTGVGLALVQRVIHRHGGRVWAEAKLNEGSAFYFTLPMRKHGT